METYKICRENDRHKHDYGYEYCSSNDYNSLLKTIMWINKNGYEIVAITQDSGGHWVFYDADPKD